MLSPRVFRVPPRIYFGENSAREAGSEAKSFGGRKALVVTDKVLMDNGTIEPVLDSLKKAGVAIVIFDGVNSEPNLVHVDQCLALYRREVCDFLVAVGGGSPIDTAKAVAILASNGGKIQDYMGLGKVQKSGPPLLAIPTTAGTGSEVTLFTIITDTDKDVKMLIGSPPVMPSAALVDPLLTLKMPRKLTGATGLDALTHAIEAYVSVKAQPMSDVLALSAIRLLAEYLPQAWANPENREARSQVMLGSLQAGMAFTNASVALVHGMSRPIGAYFHVSHGISNAALLAVVMEFSLLGSPRRYAEIAAAMGEPIAGLTPMEAAQRGVEVVKRLVRQLQIPKLSGLGVSREKLDSLAGKMADDAIASGSPGNNPLKPTKEEIVSLYYEAL